MLWLPQLSFDFTEDSLGQFDLRRFFLGMVDQLEDEGADGPLEPSGRAEILTVLDQLAVKLAKCVCRLFLGECVETLFTEVVPLVRLITFYVVFLFHRLCIVIFMSMVRSAPQLFRDELPSFSVCVSNEVTRFACAQTFGST